MAPSAFAMWSITMPYTAVKGRPSEGPGPAWAAGTVLQEAMASTGSEMDRKRAGFQAHIP